MALFGKKKDEVSPSNGTPAQNTPAGNSSADPNTFDFEAIARDLDAQNGASSFDALLSQPATPQTTPLDSTTSVNDPLGLSTPSTPVSSPQPQVIPSTAAVSSPDTVINAPISVPTPIAPATSTASGTPIPPIGTTEVRTKKPFPLIPLLGALGLLAVAGGGAMFMLNSGNSTPDIPTAPPRPITNAALPSGPPGSAPPAPGGVQAPAGVVPPGNSAPPAPNPGTRSASPGIPPVGVAPGGSPGVAIQVPNTAKAPSATQGLDSRMALRLKALWKVGADAKHRHDYAAARKAWGDALQLRPGHPGFQDAIDKLPR